MGRHGIGIEAPLHDQVAIAREEGAFQRRGQANSGPGGPAQRPVAPERVLGALHAPLQDLLRAAVHRCRRARVRGCGDEIGEARERDRATAGPDVVRQLDPKRGLDSRQQVHERQRVEADSELAERDVERQLPVAAEEKLLADDPHELLLDRIRAHASMSSSRRRTFPVDVRGRAARISIRRGTLYSASVERQNDSSSVSSAAPESSTAAYTTCSPRPSGTPRTAASRTAGCRCSVAVTSAGDTLSPPTLITVSFRPSSVRKPASSIRPRSPVRKTPSPNGDGSGGAPST